MKRPMVDPATLPLLPFTVFIAALDAFNPCAFFVLPFLLSLIAHQKDRRRMLMIGGIFVAALAVTLAAARLTRAPPDSRRR